MKIIHLTSIDDERVAAYVNLTELQLRNRLEPEKGIFIAESVKVIDRAIAAGCEPLSLLVEEAWLCGMQPTFDAINERWGNDIPIYVASEEELQKLTGYRLHRGAISAMRRWKLPSVAEVCKNAQRIAVMENIVDHTNVGALIRSAAALDIDAVLVSPSCGDPLYRRAARVSMGTVFQVAWTRISENTLSAELSSNTTDTTTQTLSRNQRLHERARRIWPDAGLHELHHLGFTTASMALREDSISLDELRERLTSPANTANHIDKIALIFGTEGEGLMPRTIAQTDLTVKIAMSHGVDSLNVAASSAVAFYALRRHHM